MRLFIAVELADEVRAALVDVQNSLRQWSRAVKWVEGPQLHMTVKFLGDAVDAQVAEISEALAAATHGVDSFDMRLDGAGCFPPHGPVRIVWVAMHEQSGRLARCVETVEETMAKLGFERESRPFSPHLTIGRVRDDSSGDRLRAAVETAPVRPAAQPVAFLSLMSSVLSPRGPSYSVVSRAKLERPN